MTAQGWLEGALWGISAVLLAIAGSSVFHLRWARRLPSLASLAANGLIRPSSAASLPRVSVVLAARDEEARIENTVRHLLAQHAVDVDIVAVDDRSADRTSDILRRLAQADPRVRPLRVDVLPDGWLGKCHACHLGAAAATGTWILFTDADCWLKPDVTARALQTAERDAVDHLTLTPGIASTAVGARAWHLAFLITLANWFSGVNRDKPNAHLGLGAFNLVKATAYRACGGYEALRLTVLDDVKLGLLLRRAGYRTRAFIGGDDTECHWGASVRGMIGNMEKNYFAAIDYRTGAAAGVVSIGAVIFGGAVVGPLTGTLAGYAAGISLLSLAVPAGVVASRLGWSRLTALLTPFIFPVLIYAILNSTIVTLRHGGIRWRGTFYPLAMLRRGSVR